MELVTNGGDGHRQAIWSALGESREALVAVAFLKRAGAVFLGETLGPVLEAGGRAEVFVGTDFFLTEPDALQALLDLANSNASLHLYLGSRAPGTFHPKTYAGFGADTLRCVVGSANLTGGALGCNVEASILVEAESGSPFADDVRAFFATLRGGGRFSPLDALGLAVYRSSWKPVERERGRLDRTISEADAGRFDLAGLDALYRQYTADPGNAAELEMRKANRAIARTVQKRIAALAGNGVTPAARDRLLRGHLQDLMSSADGGRHLWPSDAIFRRANAALEYPEMLIGLFRAGEGAARMSAPEGFRVLSDIARRLPGVGINMITEILSTYAPNRFAVVNGNTVAALAHLGLTFTGSTTLGLEHVKPQRYAEITGLIQAVRDRIGADDFPEADAFLNWVYRQT